MSWAGEMGISVANWEGANLDSFHRKVASVGGHERQVVDCRRGSDERVWERELNARLSILIDPSIGLIGNGDGNWQADERIQESHGGRFLLRLHSGYEIDAADDRDAELTLGSKVVQEGQGGWPTA